MRIFFLTSRFPYPLEKGDKLRAYHQIKYLSEYHDIYLCCLSDIEVNASDLRHLDSLCKEVIVLPLKKWKCYGKALTSLFLELPIQVAYFQDSSHKETIEKLIERIKPDHIFCQLIRCSDYVKSSEVPKTIDYMDAFSFGILNKSKKVAFPWNWVWGREARQLSVFEQKTFPYFQHHLIISEQDRDALDLNQKNKIQIVPNGVDFEFFKPETQTKTYDILFVGNMGYPPNQIAARYLIKRIMPLLWEKGLELKVLLAGARPNKSLKQLASDRVKVSGWMDDIRDAYNASKIVVAPIFTGSGLQNKILEAMAMGLPCVTSTQVTTGIKAQAEEHLLVADNPHAFAFAIEKLLGDDDLIEQLKNNARNWIFENYKWDKIVHSLNQIITSNHER